MSDATFFREPPRRDVATWLVAGLLMAGLHVGAALLLIQRQPVEPARPLGDVVDVDLAPPDAATDAARLSEVGTEPAQPPPPLPAAAAPEQPSPPPIVPPAMAPPSEAVAPSAPLLPVLPEVEAPLEVAKPVERSVSDAQAQEAQRRTELRHAEIAKQAQDAKAQDARQAALKQQQAAREQLLARQRADERAAQQRETKLRDAKQREAKQREAKLRAEADAQRREAASRAGARGDNPAGATSRRASGATLAAWKSGISARVAGLVHGYASDGAGSASWYVSPNGAVTRVSGSGAAASAARALGSVQPPPDRLGHPFSFTVRGSSGE